MSKRAHNFCAGPAALPTAVLERAQAEMLDWQGKGLSVMEMSHRSDEYVAIAEKADLTKDQANRVLNAVLEEITSALNRKDSVTLVGFGTFLQRHRGARTGKNPQTGAPVKIKASNTVAFKPGKSLRDAVN